eukprot:4035056-Prymnesium_polylepis.1
MAAATHRETRAQLTQHLGGTEMSALPRIPRMRMTAWCTRGGRPSAWGRSPEEAAKPTCVVVRFDT